MAGRVMKVSSYLLVSIIVLSVVAAGASLTISHILNSSPRAETLSASGASWWNSSWQYRKPITITNDSSSALTDYQVLLTIDTSSLVSAGKMRSDCGDLRFATAAGTELSYWVESGANTSETKVWVKVPSIPTGTVDIYMYYGKSDETSVGNGGNTFIFFDDFSGSTLSPTKWDVMAGSASVAGGILTVSGSGYVRGKTTIPIGSATHIRMEVLSGIPQIVAGIAEQLGWYALGSTWYHDYSTAVREVGLFLTYWQSGYYYRVACHETEDPDYTEPGTTSYTLGWKNTQIRWEANKGTYIFPEGTYTLTSKIPGATRTPKVVLNSGYSGKVGNYDVVFSRKFTDPEPTASFGTEEAMQSSTAISISQSSFTLNSGGSVSLTATLTSSGSPVSAKTINWSASTGTLSASSGTTNSSGQATVTYTAPSVTTQTSVTITASFAGDSSYQSSSGSSAGTITVSVLPSTTLSVSPSSFTLSGSGSTNLTATLASSGSLLSSKTVTWSVTSGSLSASSGTTNSSGQASVTYTAPSVITSSSVTITASFAGDSSYQSSSGSSVGTITVSVLPSTTLSVSPSSFTLGGSESTNLTATLVSSGSLLANKTVTWSVTSGNLSVTSATTNSSGQASVTYTAPSVTTQTTVTVTASFAGDSSYSSSQASSFGTVSTATAAKVSTSIVISPLVFDAKPGENVALTILLTVEDGALIAGKTVTLGTTIGSVVPSSATTNSSGIITATFTAPTVDVRTSFIITASFAGDDEYSSKTEYSTGTVLTPVLAETVERLENTMERLEVSVENLTSKIESLTNAIAENRVGLGIVIENGHSTTEYEHSEIDAQVEIRGTNIDVRVDSQVENGKTVLINIDNYTKKVLQLDHITVWIDNEEITQADNYDDVLDPTNDGGEAEYLILVGGNGVQVLVSIPHFSAHTITIGTMPTVPTAGIPSLYLMLGAALGLVVVTVAVVWHHLQKSRLETTSMLIEHGMKGMRIVEAEVTREIRELGEFTITELMQRTGSSKTIVWRTVHKLMENGIVEPTEQVKPPVSGSGRGKPSLVYKYVGK